ncbi:hypothetical protein AAMO2058_000209500 [Amorphochlora amoebiformis]
MNSPLRALGISQVYGSVDSDGSEGKRGGLRQRLLAWDRFAWMFGLIGGVALSFLLVTTIMSDPRKKSATGSEHVDIDLSDAFGSIFTVDQAPVLIAACFLVLMAASMVVVGCCLIRQLNVERSRIRHLESLLDLEDGRLFGQENKTRLGMDQSDRRVDDMRARWIGSKDEIMMTRRTHLSDINALRAHIFNLYVSSKKLEVRARIMAEAQEAIAQKRPYFGITVDDAVGQGAVVKRVTEGSPGYRQGILQGDVITAFAGSPVENKAQFLRYLKDTFPGDMVWVEVLRNNRIKMIMLVVGCRDNKLDIRSLRLKAIGVVTEKDCKEFVATVAGETGVHKSETAGAVDGSFYSEDSVDEDVPGLVSPSDQLINTFARVQSKINVLRGVATCIADKENRGLKSMLAAQRALADLRPYLGISVEPVAGQGMSVTRISKGSPGDLQGIKKGDVIHKINGVKVPTIKKWLACLKEIRPGNVTLLEIIRGTTHTLAIVEVGTRRLDFKGIENLYLAAAGLPPPSDDKRKRAFSTSDSPNRATADMPERKGE